MPEGPDALYEHIDQLLTKEAFDEAKVALDAAPDTEPAKILRIKLGLLSDSMPPGVAMQKLIQLMREKPDLPGAKELYQQASKLAYSGRESSVAHSHPPPPVRPNPSKS